MAPKIRYDNLPPNADSHGHNSLQSSLASSREVLALVLELMALINARFDAHASYVVAQRHRDVQCNTPRDVQPTTTIMSNLGELPSPPPHPHLGYPAQNHGRPLISRTTFLLLVANRTRTVCRRLCIVIPRLLVGRPLSLLANPFPKLTVASTADVGVVAPPWTH
jgi:hypothetical protein